MQLFFVKICEKVLDKVGISVSKSLIPNDMRPAFAPSGLRIGTPAMTTRGMSESDARRFAHLIDRAIKQRNNSAELAVLRERRWELLLRGFLCQGSRVCIDYFELVIIFCIEKIPNQGDFSAF